MINRFYISIPVVVLMLTFVSCSGQFGNILKEVGLEEVSTEEVAMGLKEALTSGTSKGSDQLSARDAFYKSIYKIALPQDAKNVCDKLRVIPGFTKLEDDMVRKINYAAEDAAKKAKPIFVQAIKQITIKDAWNILRGSDNAATEYLQKTTTQALYAEFNPVITQALNQQGALDLWSSAVTSYNKIPFVKQANPDIAAYVTNKALDALFSKIAIEEKNIRNNLAARTSDLLKKVFAKQDK
ncbi:MAG: DUF4197 domain-containing protein [Saprospiraceae bacterium]|jgi:hypothetical protein|nr:DUF4197 domain-containing protein [Saprospiraceae bacterium]MBK7796508.1 DUF4197 domain-containing protein [Saprospiraceae bacterium]MBK8152784.1 DUF4197 domain-containing protein [Saprospiraceae bacterium]MBL0260100.1 DUF4197 domain-containing protein [Saprospiraceae bacterium]